jgi:hypothetical protein
LGKLACTPIKTRERAERRLAREFTLRRVFWRSSGWAREAVLRKARLNMGEDRSGFRWRNSRRAKRGGTSRRCLPGLSYSAA